MGNDFSGCAHPTIKQAKTNNRFACQLLAAISLVFLVPAEQRSQVFFVRGNVATVEKPVSNASVIFIDKNDSTRKYSAFTDTSGNYRLERISKMKI